MNSPGKGSVLIAILIGICCPAFSAESDLPGLEGVPLIVAEVNSRSIHRNELIRELVGSAGASALDRLVRRTLIEQAAQSLNVSATEEEIEQQFKIDKRDLMAELIHTPGGRKNNEFPIEEIIQARFRMTLDEYKNTVVRQRLLIRRCVARDLQPTNDDLRRFFNAYPLFFQQPVKYHASHILISPLDPRDLHRGLRFRSAAAQMESIDRERKKRINLARDHGIDFTNAPPIDSLGAEWLRSRQSAEKLLRDIRSGIITWDQAVREYSQDPIDHPSIDPQSRRRGPSEREKMRLPPGDVGWFHSNGPLVAEFYDGAKNMKVGDMDGPVRTEFGYHLIKMLEIQSPPTESFEQCNERVRRLFIENEIQLRSEAWLNNLIDQARLGPSQIAVSKSGVQEVETGRLLLWPPAPVDGVRVGFDTVPASTSPDDNDPIVGSVNSRMLRRSEVWRELIHSEGDEALARLVNREMVMGMLKPMGLDRLEWESADPGHRRSQPPAAEPIRISAETIDLELNGDRLRQDREAPDVSFKSYIFQRYGQSVDEYKRAIEAGLVLREAIRRKVPLDEGTLRVQFAMARQRYDVPAWYEISHVLIVPTGGMAKADANAHLQARLIAEQVYKNYVADPGSFPQLVQDFSMDSAANKGRGGSLGACYPDERNSYLPEGPLLHAEIKKQNLEKGQVSTTIRSSMGYHIIRVDSVHPERQAEFGEVKSRIEKDYLQERAKMYSDIWLRALNAQAKVKRFLFAPPPDASEENSLPPDNFTVPGTREKSQ